MRLLREGWEAATRGVGRVVEGQMCGGLIPAHSPLAEWKFFSVMWLELMASGVQQHLPTNAGNSFASPSGSAHLLMALGAENGGRGGSRSAEIFWMEVLYGHRGGVGGRGVELSSPGFRWRVTSRDPLPDLLGIHILCKQSGSLLAIPPTRQFPLTKRG